MKFQGNQEGRRKTFSLKCANGQTIEADFVVLGIAACKAISASSVAPVKTCLSCNISSTIPTNTRAKRLSLSAPAMRRSRTPWRWRNRNNVVIVNRKDEFGRAKKGNEQAILKAIEDGLIECYYDSAPDRVDALSVGRKKGRMILSTKNGKAQILIDRIIARLGATAPRGFVEGCGVTFPNKDPASVPAISPQYESNVQGLYIVGALGGYPLIKQAMNQGYEVVEYILGEKVEPADEPLLKAKFAAMPGFRSVNETLERVQKNVRVLAQITPLQLREFMLDSNVRTPKAGEAIFQRNDYTNSFFSIVEGEVRVVLDETTNSGITLRRGEFFGEMSLISGRRRSATVVAGAGCVLIETPRRSMNRLINSVEGVKREIDQVFVMRAIQSRFAPEADGKQLADIVATAKLQRFQAGDVLFSEGEAGDCLHLVRVGSLTISRNIGGKDVVLSYVAAGNYVGEMALLGEAKRSATARAAIASETIRLDGVSFKKLVSRIPMLKLRLQDEYRQRTTANLAMQALPDGGNIISFLIAQGAGEAT